MAQRQPISTDYPALTDDDSGRPSLLRTNRPDTADDSRQLDNAEARMRQALGLNGRPPSGAARQAPSHGLGHGTGHGLASEPRKRRFVQDGEVPVVLVNGASHGAAPGAAESGDAAQSSRSDALAALQQERTARERSDRALREAQAVIHDLRTKLGHSEMACNEAREALHREQTERAAIAQRLQELEAARPPAAARVAERQVNDTTPPQASSPQATLSLATPPLAKRTQAARKPRTATAEPRPVKWWLKGSTAKS
jgi:hypothetical protein